MIERFILCHTDISFKFIKNGKTVLHSPGNCDAHSALYSVYGKDIVASCREIDSNIDGIIVKGFAGLPKISRASRSEQIVFVNQRLIRSKTITSAIDAAYTNMLMKGKYAFVILDIRMPSADLDVNVHPQKAEVRFSNESAIYRAVYHALSNTLATESMSIDYSFSSSSQKAVSDQAVSHETVAKQEMKQTSGYKAPEPVSKTLKEPPVNNCNPEILTSAPAKVQKEPDEQYYAMGEVEAPLPVEAIPEPKVFEKLQVPNTEKVISEQPVIEEVIPQTKTESMNELMSARLIGTLFDTYILLEASDNSCS